MLRQRIITAVLMIAVLLTAIALLPLTWMAALMGILVALGAWEWSRMAGWENPWLRALYVAVFALLNVGIFLHLDLNNAPGREMVQPFLGVACLWWSFSLLWVKSYPSSTVIWGSKVGRSLMGFVILALGWTAAVYLLSFPRGGQLLVVMVAIVVAADVGAYFAGRAFGKHKLALRVSPNKTWEGFWGGMLAAALLSVVLWQLLPARLSHLGLGSVVAITLCTAVASVVGDLSVSMVKRHSGIKDSGSLLPGHGGVLDRLDSLSAAAPVFALSLLLAGI